MRHRQIVCAFAGCFVLALVLAATHRISAQQAADPNRPTSEQVAKVSLAEVGLPQGAASATRFTYAPGKAMAPHTHTGRTSIITVVQGHLTEHRGDVVLDSLPAQIQLRGELDGGNTGGHTFQDPGVGFAEHRVPVGRRAL